MVQNESQQTSCQEADKEKWFLGPPLLGGLPGETF